MKYLLSLLLIYLPWQVFSQVNAPRISNTDAVEIDGGTFYQSLDGKGYYYLPSELRLKANKEGEWMFLFMFTEYEGETSLVINAHLLTGPNITRDSIKILLRGAIYYGVYPSYHQYQNTKSSKKVAAFLKYTSGDDTVSEKISQVLQTNNQIVLSHKIEGEQALKIRKEALKNTTSKLRLNVEIPVDLTRLGDGLSYGFSQKEVKEVCQLIPEKGFEEFKAAAGKIISSKHKNLSGSTKKKLRASIQKYCFNGGLDNSSRTSSSATTKSTINTKGKLKITKKEQTEKTNIKTIPEMISFVLPQEKDLITSVLSTIELYPFIKYNR